MTDSTVSACCLGNLVNYRRGGGGGGGEEARLTGCSEDDMIDRTGTEHRGRVEVAVCAKSQAGRKKLSGDGCEIRHDNP